MSKNCINCVKNPRTGADLLCDTCRAAHHPGFDGNKRWGNSAVEGAGVNSPAMMEARAAFNAAKRYTIADIRAANIAAGKFFFSRDTMKHFHESVSDWGVRHVGGRVFIHHKNSGQVREFNPRTGAIGLPLKVDRHALPEYVAANPASAT